MKVKNVAKSIDVIIGGLEDLKKEILDLETDTSIEPETAKEVNETEKTSEKPESDNKKKVSKKSKAAEKTDDEVDYSSMKYNELKKLAVDKGMKSPNVSKSELIAFLSGEDTDLGDEAEEVESEDVENVSDEEDLTEKVTKLLDGVDTEDIAGFLTENGISAKGKRPSLIAKIVTAIEDGDLSLEDLEVEDDSEEEVEEAPKKTNKKSDKSKSKKSAKVEEPEEDDEEEPEDVGYVEDEDGNFVNELEENELLHTVSADRYEAYEKYISKVEKDIKKKSVKAELIDELEEFFGDDFDSKKDDVVEFAGIKFLLMTDDEGETHDMEEPYEINEIACCCGQPLTETEDGFVCDICGSEYDED